MLKQNVLSIGIAVIKPIVRLKQVRIAESMALFCILIPHAGIFMLVEFHCQCVVHVVTMNGHDALCLCCPETLIGHVQHCDFMFRAVCSYLRFALLKR